MAFQLKNKVLIITGASNGIGAKILRQSLAEGVEQIYNLDIDVENGLALEKELNTKYGDEKVKFIECDVSNEERLRTNFETLLGDKNKNYVVVNNAGVFNENTQVLKKEIDVNLTAVITGSLIALELMRTDKGGNGGTIINISSIAALKPFTVSPVYNATKNAVLNFSICIGAEDYYKRTNVRVLTICFGLTETSITMKENMEFFDKANEKIVDDIITSLPSQSAESAGRAVIDAFKQGASASVWLSSAGKPAEDITDFVTKAYKTLEEPIFK